MNAMTVLRGAAAARIGIGAAMALGTRPLLKAMLRNEEASSSFLLFARTVGIRDALFGLGCLLAGLGGKAPDETRRWVQLWLANEVADVVAAIASSRKLGVTGATTAAAVPLPFIAADIWVLGHLDAASNRRD